jgi:hypothetical protein
VGEYVGELITTDEARRREADGDAPPVGVEAGAGTGAGTDEESKGG